MTGGKGGISSCSCSDWHAWCHGASWGCWCFPQMKVVCFHITKTYQYINLCGMASSWLICSWRLKKPLGMVPDQGLWFLRVQKCILQLFLSGKIFIFSRDKLNDLSWEKPTSEGVVKWTNYIWDLLHFTCYPVVTVTLWNRQTSRSWWLHGAGYVFGG